MAARFGFMAHYVHSPRPGVEADSCGFPKVIFGWVSVQAVLGRQVKRLLGYKLGANAAASAPLPFPAMVAPISSAGTSPRRSRRSRRRASAVISRGWAHHPGAMLEHGLADAGAA
jgi:hypothetical protein